MLENAGLGGGDHVSSFYSVDPTIFPFVGRDHHNIILFQNLVINVKWIKKITLVFANEGQWSAPPSTLIPPYFADTKNISLK